eukprot:6195312-Pleurochrysis_carterae.AAC.1
MAAPSLLFHVLIKRGVLGAGQSESIRSHHQRHPGEPDGTGESWREARGGGTVPGTWKERVIRRAHFYA